MEEVDYRALPRGRFGYPIGLAGSLKTNVFPIDPRKAKATLLAIDAAMSGSVIRADFGHASDHGKIRPMFQATVRDGAIVVVDLRSWSQRVVHECVDGISGFGGRAFH
jgi:hypothetical protein